MIALGHVELSDANAFVEAKHRHHKAVRGHRFSIGAVRGGILVGVAIVGRPVARAIDYRSVVEVLRLCTDGSRNTCSFLYGAAARAAHAVGYERIQTYILCSEPGVSLRASGWQLSHETVGGSWNCNVRKGRREDQPQEPKQLWYRYL